jgi:hypothetical protein
MADLVMARIRIVIYYTNSTQNHAGSAKATLESMIFSKGFLHGMQFVTVGKAFNS